MVLYDEVSDIVTRVGAVLTASLARCVGEPTSCRLYKLSFELCAHSMPLLLPEHAGVPLQDRNRINNPLVLDAHLSAVDALHYHRLLINEH